MKALTTLPKVEIINGLKLKADRSLVEALTVSVKYLFSYEYTDILFQKWLRRALKSVIVKLDRAMDRIRKALTLSFNESEALALKYSCEVYHTHFPFSLEGLLINRDFIQPVAALDQKIVT